MSGNSEIGMALLKALTQALGPKAIGQIQRGQRLGRREREKFTNTVSMVKPKAYVPKGPALDEHGLPLYGTAETPKAGPEVVHKARVAQLDAAVPGLSKMAFIYSVGVDAKGKYTREYGQMVNTPFTWVDLPGGKEFKTVGMNPDQVRRALKACGYGFSKTNNLWACDSKGRPVNRRAGRCRGVGKAMLDDNQESAA
ncbi:MAG: hypothetical protein IT443_12030 [Phycisphaeraceae bacterium]|nr:hypothetical protein [Phycisphaeraceae bacterium]